MKQSVSPQVFFVVTAVMVVLVGVLVVWVWNRPSSVPEPPGPGGSRVGKPNPMSEHGGPTPEQRKQIEEWKKTHPNATTRY